MADDDDSDKENGGSGEPLPSPCCCGSDGKVPKSTVSASCVPLQLYEGVPTTMKTIRGRCVILPSTNANGQAECIPFVIGNHFPEPALVTAVQQQQETTTTTTILVDWLRPIVAELVGTAALVFIVVGSGISGETYSADIGLALTMNAAATFAGLYGLILILGPVSGAHFNPIVSTVHLMLQEEGTMTLPVLAWYVVAQTAGAILGALLANVTYDVSFEFSETPRHDLHLWISEVLGTATLLLIIHGCLRTGNALNIPFAVAAWVGGGYFTFSSTIFANPAVTIGRMFSNAFAGIAPSSAWIYICFQCIGAVLGCIAIIFLYPNKPKKCC